MARQFVSRMAKTITPERRGLGRWAMGTVGREKERYVRYTMSMCHVCSVQSTVGDRKNVYIRYIRVEPLELGAFPSVRLFFSLSLFFFVFAEEMEIGRGAELCF